MVSQADAASTAASLVALMAVQVADRQVAAMVVVSMVAVSRVVRTVAAVREAIQAVA